MGRHEAGQAPQQARRTAVALPVDPRRGSPRPRPGVVASTGQIPVRSGGPTGTAPIPVQAPAPRPLALPPSRLRTPPAPPAPAPRPRRRPLRALLATAAVAGLAAVTGIPAFAIVEGGESRSTVGDGDEQQYRAGADVSGQSVSLDSMTGVSPIAVTTWTRPVVGTLGDPFGPRPIQPVPGVSLFHRGQDIVAGCGSTIRAAAAGTVEYAGWYGTYGNWILVSHGGGIETGYAHEERLLVSVGQHVSAGQPIGLVGETGAATGCHLHLEVHVDGVAINPVPFFTARGVKLGG